MNIYFNQYILGKNENASGAFSNTFYFTNSKILPHNQQQFSKAVTGPSPSVDSALPSTSIRLLKAKRVAVAISQAGPCSKPGVIGVIDPVFSPTDDNVSSFATTTAQSRRNLCLGRNCGRTQHRKLNDFRQASAAVTFR
jgi:hypothetical protein